MKNSPKTNGFSSWWFPTCQVRFARFYLAASPSPPPPPPSASSSSSSPPGLRNSIWVIIYRSSSQQLRLILARPQWRWSAPGVRHRARRPARIPAGCSVRHRTRTARIPAGCSPPDPNCDGRRRVFATGPELRGFQPSVCHRTRRNIRKNVRRYVRRYARKNVRKNVRRYARNNVRRYVRKLFRLDFACTFHVLCMLFCLHLAWRYEVCMCFASSLHLFCRYISCVVHVFCIYAVSILDVFCMYFAKLQRLWFYFACILHLLCRHF